MLVICQDEKTRLNVLKPDGEHYKLIATPKMLADFDNDTEFDMEGVAADGDDLYVIGSHSLAREKLKPTGNYADNRELMTKIKDEDRSRDAIFHFKLTDEAQIIDQDAERLFDEIKKDNILGNSLTIPSKENGVDIEGVAAKNGILYLGLRGPVLRDNWAIVMVGKFNFPDGHELRFLNLGGRGIRDLAAVDNGFLVLAGPVGDGDSSYELYHWNGKDCLPGFEGPDGEVTRVGEILPTDGGKPEAIAVMSQTDEAWKLLVVQDGVNGGRLFSVRKPE